LRASLCGKKKERDGQNRDASIEKKRKEGRGARFTFYPKRGERAPLP